ncbi:MAG: Calx-beta domain-containing protein, partial [Geitlerinemataceae cyanobacterium]
AYSDKFATRLRSTISAQEDALRSRDIGVNFIDPPDNVIIPVNFLADFQATGASENDIALFTTRDAQLPASDVIGLIAFVNPLSARGLTIDTAGYPGDNVESNIPGNSGEDSRDFVRSPGAAESPGIIEDAGLNRKFFYSPNVDTAGGQSGSGVWHTLAGDNIPRVLGVHTQGAGGDYRFGPDFLKRNSGVLITTDIYNNIVAQMAADSGTANANLLPENAIIGSDPIFIPSVGVFGDDFIRGSYRKERILGQGGDDQIFGGGANDRLEGGRGFDRALFSDAFRNYNFTITGPGDFTIAHLGGTGFEGTDTTTDIEFGVFEFEDANGDGVDDDGNQFIVPLLVDPNNPNKWRDGDLVNFDTPISNNAGNSIGSLGVDSPTWTIDGDVDYRLTIGTTQGTLFNIAYIIDTSGSMSGRQLQEAKNAYASLTNALVDSGLADNSLFTVIPFNSEARPSNLLDSTEAISEIRSLEAEGGTNFNAALREATRFFNRSSRAGLTQRSGVTNIAYFLSDGDPTVGGENFSANAADLRSVADVRAFGIGESDIRNLNIVDTGRAQRLDDPTDLAEAFTASRVDRNSIDRIEVKLDGVVIDTIAPGELTQNALGLQYRGTLDGLDVSRTARNNITFEVVFDDGTPTTALDYTITTGQEQSTRPTSDGTGLAIAFGIGQSDFTGSIESEQVTGNDLDNTIAGGGGDNTLSGNGGDDRFILSNDGTNVVDGGSGVDTVSIHKTQAEAGEISQTGNIINIGNDTTLLNVEFIEFSDVRLSTSTLSAVPILSLAQTAISITEGDAASNLATFTVNLSNAATEDVVIDFTTEAIAATAGTDFVATPGQLIIPAGERSGEISIEILDDTNAEGEEQILLNLTAVSGGTFANGGTEETVGINILDNDSAISVPIVGDDFTIVEGDPDAASTFTLTLNRFGSLTGSDTISVEIVSAGSNPAQESDLVNGFSSSQVTFAPGESSKTIEIPIAPDDDIEDDETFGVRITPVSGAATVPSGEIVFSIVDDDRTIDLSRQTEDNTLVIESSEKFNFEIAKNITDVSFSRQLLAISVEGETPIFSTLGHPFGTQRTFAIDNLLTNVELQSGAFRFALQDPDGTITPLELSNLTDDGFELSGNGLDISASIADGTEPTFVDRVPVGTEAAIGISMPDELDPLTNARVTVSATLHRETGKNNTIGFYLADAANDGAVIDPVTGEAIADSTSSNRLGHLQAALNHTLISAEAPAENRLTIVEETFDLPNLTPDRDLLLVPYMIADGDASQLPPDLSNMYTNFLGTNADGVQHVRRLSSHAFGFEDSVGGGDYDFDDTIVEINNFQVSLV